MLGYFVKSGGLDGERSGCDTNCLENTTAHVQEYRTNVKTDGTENGNHFVSLFVQTVQFEQIIYLAQSMTMSLYHYF